MSAYNMFSNVFTFFSSHANLCLFSASRFVFLSFSILTYLRESVDANLCVCVCVYYNMRGIHGRGEYEVRNITVTHLITIC